MVDYAIGFYALFILSGIGNGLCNTLTAVIFEARAPSAVIAEAEQVVVAVDVSALIGPAGAAHALGGVGVNLAPESPPDQWHGHPALGLRLPGRLGADLGPATEVSARA